VVYLRVPQEDDSCRYVQAQQSTGRHSTTEAGHGTTGARQGEPPTFSISTQAKSRTTAEITPSCPGQLLGRARAREIAPIAAMCENQRSWTHVPAKLWLELRGGCGGAVQQVEAAGWRTGPAIPRITAAQHTRELCQPRS
jgi:hypothetical protein